MSRQGSVLLAPSQGNLLSNPMADRLGSGRQASSSLRGNSVRLPDFPADRLQAARAAAAAQADGYDAYHRPSSGYRQQQLPLSQTPVSQQQQLYQQQQQQQQQLYQQQQQQQLYQQQYQAAQQQYQAQAQAHLSHGYARSISTPRSSGNRAPAPTPAPIPVPSITPSSAYQPSYAYQSPVAAQPGAGRASGNTRSSILDSWRMPSAGRQSPQGSLLAARAAPMRQESLTEPSIRARSGDMSRPPLYSPAYIQQQQQQQQQPSILNATAPLQSSSPHLQPQPQRMLSTFTAPGQRPPSGTIQGGGGLLQRAAPGPGAAGAGLGPGRASSVPRGSSLPPQGYGLQQLQQPSYAPAYYQQQPHLAQPQQWQGGYAAADAHGVAQVAQPFPAMAMAAAPVDLHHSSSGATGTRQLQQHVPYPLSVPAQYSTSPHSSPHLLPLSPSMAAGGLGSCREAVGGPVAAGSPLHQSLQQPQQPSQQPTQQPTQQHPSPHGSLQHPSPSFLPSRAEAPSPRTSLPGTGPALAPTSGGVGDRPALGGGGERSAPSSADSSTTSLADSQGSRDSGASASTYTTAASTSSRRSSASAAPTPYSSLPSSAGAGASGALQQQQQQAAPQASQPSPGRGSGTGAARQGLGAQVCWPSLASALGSSPVAGQGCVGLQNLGNTCFINSILQSLNTVPELVAWMHAARSGSGFGPGAGAAGGSAPWAPRALAAPAYADLVSSVWSSGQGSSALSPREFVRRLGKLDERWGDGSQQDSQEFLHSLLEALQTDTNRITCKPQYKELAGKGSEEEQASEALSYARCWHDSVIDDLFGGLLQSTLQCGVCGRKSHSFEPTLGLCIPIVAPASKGGSVTLQDCLQAFTTTEKLDGNDSVRCEACKRNQPHTKRLQIFRYPRILVITLKRFLAPRLSGAASLFSRFRSTAKNTTAVSLEPDALDVSPFCNQAGLRMQQQHGGAASPLPVYQLTAVSHHSGSLEGGHYTASGRSAADGAWYSFNDSTVRKDSGARPAGASSTAYVLIYRLAGS